MDAQLSSDLVLATIGLLATAGLVVVVGAFWSLGRQGNRKD